MHPTILAVIVFLALLVAIWIGHQFPGHQLPADTKDTVKLAIGFIGTMSALLLGLLVRSAKGNFDAERTQVIQMAAKAAYLDRILSLYGPESLEARTQFHSAMEDAIRRLWPGHTSLTAQLAPNVKAGDSVYFAIEALTPHNDTQKKLKTMAEADAADLAQLRALLIAQSEAGISSPLLLVVAFWLVIIFGGFSFLAPPHRTANFALVISALAVAGAIFLLVELDQPFYGLIRIPSREMVDVLNQLPK
jgi:hypothetical protein